MGAAEFSHNSSVTLRINVSNMEPTNWGPRAKNLSLFFSFFWGVRGLGGGVYYSAGAQRWPLGLPSPPRPFHGVKATCCPVRTDDDVRDFSFLRPRRPDTIVVRRN